MAMIYCKVTQKVVKVAHKLGLYSSGPENRKVAQKWPKKSAQVAHKLGKWPKSGPKKVPKWPINLESGPKVAQK
jgi:hypothetical protein